MEDKIVEILGKLENAVSTGAPVVWELHVRQVYVESIVGIVFWTTFFLCVTAANFWLRRIAMKTKDEIDRSLQVGKVWVFTLMFSVLALINARSFVVQILNPEYYAMLNIVEMLK